MGGAGRRKERREPQPLSGKLALRTEPRVGLGTEEEEEEAGDKKGPILPSKQDHSYPSGHRSPVPTAALSPGAAAPSSHTLPV